MNSSFASPQLSAEAGTATPSPQPTQPIVTPPQTTLPVKPKSPLSVVIILLLLAALGYLGYQNWQLQEQVNRFNEIIKVDNTPYDFPSPSPFPSSSPTPSVDQTEIQWRQTPLMGSYSFEYPDGWHVASQWSNSTAQGIYIWIDPEPISGAPRGGPAATIEITDINGISNSEEVFNQKLEMYRNDYENVNEETINSSLGKIYHFTGTLTEGYLGGAAIEVYLLRIVRPNDAINDHIIILSTINQQKYSDFLKHIALSIKTLY